jgi:hypothetical protein
MASHLNAFEDARNRFTIEHAKYKRSAERLQEGAKQNSGNLSDLKAAFSAAQKKAVVFYNQVNQLAGQTALKIEESLSAYEDIELWRSEQLQGFVLRIAQWCDDIATQCHEVCVGLNSLMRLVPSDQALGELLDPEALPDCARDPKYQVVRIDPRVGQFIDPAVVFGKTGMPCSVVRECQPRGDLIAAAVGEVVAALDDKGEAVLVVNVNDIKGLIPRAALEPHRPG